MATYNYLGRAFDWAQVKINLLGRTLVGVTGIKYKETANIANNYGAGGRPVTRGYGRREIEASVTLDMHEWQAIVDLLPPGSTLVDVPGFDVVVMFDHPEKGPVTHLLQSCMFAETGVEIAEGDTKTEMEIPLACLGIVFNAA